MLEEENTSGKIHSSNPVLTTKNYDLFKQLKGNRGVDVSHAKHIMKNMLNVGNLTAEFPITVNENMEVIDGQHRLWALRELEWPVGYRIQEGLTLDTVRGINQAGQNWGWRDYATSYAENGTPEQQDQYQRFLNLEKHFHYPYSMLMRYSGLSTDRRYSALGFKNGELVIRNQERTFKMLKQYKEISDVLEHSTKKFGDAMYKVMNSEEYNHERMKHKVNLWELEVKTQGTVEDYMRLIERIYNYRTAEENRVRLYV